LIAQRAESRRELLLFAAGGASGLGSGTLFLDQPPVGVPGIAGRIGNLLQRFRRGRVTLPFGLQFGHALAARLLVLRHLGDQRIERVDLVLHSLLHDFRFLLGLQFQDGGASFHRLAQRLLLRLQCAPQRHLFTQGRPIALLLRNRGTASNQIPHRARQC